VTQFAYDEEGRRVSRTLPGGENETWAFNEKGQLSRHVDFAGQTKVYAYQGDRLETEYRYSSTASAPVPGDNLWHDATKYVYDNLQRVERLEEWTPADGYNPALRTVISYDLATGAVASEKVTKGDGTLLTEVHHEYNPATGLLIETWTGGSWASAVTDTAWGSGCWRMRPSCHPHRVITAM